MQKLTGLGRQLLLRAQLGTPPSVQKRIISPLIARKEIFRTVIQPSFDIYQLQGQNEGGSLTVTYTGTATSLRLFTKNFFTENVTQTKVGRIPVWQIQKMTEPDTGDIVIIESGKHVVDKLPRQNGIVMPGYVHLLGNVTGTWDDVKGRFRKSVRAEFRLTRKYGYTYRVSHSPHDFEQFYHKMYLPTMKTRHGQFDSSMSKLDASVYFQHGFLFLVEREGRTVAGSLCYPQLRMLSFILLGVLNADRTLMKEGVLGAMNVLRLQWANEKGFETVNFLGSEPYLKSGIFQYKRKWGARVVVPDNEDKRIWLKVQRNTPAVCQFFKDNPVIIINERTDLQGLIVVDDPANISDKDKKEWQKKYATPGLKNLLVCSMADLVNEPSCQVLSEPIIVGIEN